MFSLPGLPYDYSALEPFIDETTMHLHHDKHHQGYVDNLNKALEKYPDLQNKSIEDLMKNIGTVPEDVRTKVRNNGGGHFNHNLFWEIMKPNGGGKPKGELAEMIDKQFGSFEKFQEEFASKAIGIFGSGWVWLMSDLAIINTANQDNPVMDGKETPILGLDVWEHAYYLKYKNMRAEYVKAWWNVVNWDKVEERFKKGQILLSDSGR